MQTRELYFIRRVLTFLLLHTLFINFAHGSLEGLKTVSVVLTDTCSTSKYVGINLTISPLVSRVSCLYNFLPAADFIEKSNSSINANTTESIVAGVLYNPEWHQNGEQKNGWLSTVPDFSLWSDRSVLVVVIRYLNLTSAMSPSVCPKWEICATPSFKLGNLDTATECFSKLNWISGVCDDVVSEPYYNLFQLASGFSVLLEDVDSASGLLNSSVHMVISTGYRLPPGVFTCPPGLFACDPTTNGGPSKTLNKHLTWSYRICLPNSLWCDGVSNCPLTGSDELYCNASRLNSTEFEPPTQFPIANKDDELSMLVEELDKLGMINNTNLPVMIASLYDRHLSVLQSSTVGQVMPYTLILLLIIPMAFILRQFGCAKLRSTLYHRKPNPNDRSMLSNIETEHLQPNGHIVQINADDERHSLMCTNQIASPTLNTDVTHKV